MIEIEGGVTIPEEELSFRASRSGGPGGQNVNKVNSRVSLIFDLNASQSLNPAQKNLIRRRLAGRISKDGLLRIDSQEHRTQARNRKAAEERFARLLSKALKRRKRRKKTRVPTGVRERRLQEKSKRGDVKRNRRRPRSESSL